MKVSRELVLVTTLLVCCVGMIQPFLLRPLRTTKLPSRHQKGRAVYAVYAKNAGNGIRVKSSATALNSMYAKVAALSRNATGALLAKVAKNAMNAREAVNAKYALRSMNAKYAIIAKNAKHMITGAFPTMGPDAFDKTGDWINKYFKKKGKLPYTERKEGECATSFKESECKDIAKSLGKKFATDDEDARPTGCYEDDDIKAVVFNRAKVGRNCDHKDVVVCFCKQAKTKRSPRNQYGMSFAVVNARYAKNAAKARHAKESINAMRAGKAGRARYSKQALVAQYAENARFAKLATNALRAWKAKNAIFAHGAVNAEFARRVITEAPTTTTNTTTLVPDINTTKSPVTMD